MDELRALRREIDRGERGRGIRYPAELKQRVVLWAAERRSDGVSWPVLSAELGLGLDTVRRWCQEATGAGRARALVPVRVVAADAARTVTLVSPAGFRIEGLSAAEAVAMLRALG